MTALLPPSVALHQLMAGHWVAQALYVAAKLGLADQLAHGARSAEELAAAVGANPDALHRLMRALASLGVLRELASQRFELTAVGAFLRSSIVGSLRSLALTVGEVDWAAWGSMLHSVRTGETAFQRVHGMGPFEFFERHPDAGRVFDDAMNGFVSQNGLAVVQAYDFTRFTSIVDVGGGQGVLLSAILAASPRTRGVVFELPAVAERARASLERSSVASRCDVAAGSFFESVPPGADAYLLASILHDWDDAHCLEILQSCRRAIPDHGTLLVVEMVIPPGNDPFFGKLLDLEMLVCFGGRERSEDEYGALLAQAGFELVRVIATATPSSLLEARPAGRVPV